MIGFAFIRDGSIRRVETQDLPVKDAQRFAWSERDLLQWARELGPGAAPLLEGVLIKLGARVQSPSGKDERALSTLLWKELNQRVKTRSEGIMAKKTVAAAAPAAPVKAAVAKAPVKAAVAKAAPVPPVKPAKVKAAPAAAEEANGEVQPRSRMNPDLIIRLVDGADIPAREGTKRHQIMTELLDGRTTGEFIKIATQFGGGKKDIEIATEKGYITLEEA